MSGKGGEEHESSGCQARSGACPPVRNVTHPLRYYEFTQEEIKALEECDNESFYYRCLPFSSMFATATYVAIKQGWMSRSVHWGVVPKVVAAALAGHVCGRAAYMPRCEAKLRQLPPASQLGRVLRQHRARSHPPPDNSN